jgi:hypothetical protein
MERRRAWAYNDEKKTRGCSRVWFRYDVSRSCQEMKVWCVIKGKEEMKSEIKKFSEIALKHETFAVNSQRENL